MPSEYINTGDMVVELAALVISTAVVTGAVTGAWILWLIKKSWLASLGALLAGAAVGYIVGQLVGGFLYRIGENTTVVKVGSESLPLTIPAGLAGGVTTALTVAILAVLIFNAKSEASSLFRVAMRCGMFLGILFACLGSLL